jgi:hypothetical protein
LTVYLSSNVVEYDQNTVTVNASSVEEVSETNGGNDLHRQSAGSTTFFSCVMIH